MQNGEDRSMRQMQEFVINCISRSCREMALDNRYYDFSYLHTYYLGREYPTF